MEKEWIRTEIIKEQAYEKELSKKRKEETFKNIIIKKERKWERIKKY
jgi:hypothetical protein